MQQKPNAAIQNLPKRPGQKWWTQRRKDVLNGYLYISPFYILFAVFGLFPIIFSFGLAFFRWNGFGGLAAMEYVGIQNFVIIFSDPLFWSAVINTVIIFLMGTAPQLIIGLLLAYALNSTLIRYKNAFRVAIFVPYITSIVAVAIIFSILFSNTDSGLMNALLGYLGFDTVGWTTSYWGAKIAISAMIFWRWVGYNTLIYLAGMQSIPNDLYEAARIDGATVRQQIIYITIPMLRPFIIFIVFTATLGAFQVLTEPYIFLGRNARAEGVTVAYYLYRDAFIGGNFFGTASAVALFLFAVIMVVASINMYLTSRIGQSKSVKGGVK